MYLNFFASYLKKKNLTFGLLFFLCVGHDIVMADDGDAMFGLAWRESLGQIKKKGVVFTETTRQGTLVSVRTSELPKSLSYIESYYLLFDDKLGLVKIIAISKDFEKDVYGNKGKEKFDEIAAMLSKKYTQTEEVKKIGLELWDKSDEFYQCLAYEGCGYWSSFFESSNKSIMLKLNGDKRGVGYFQISVESIPDWEQAVASNKSKIAIKDADAL